MLNNKYNSLKAGIGKKNTVDPRQLSKIMSVVLNLVFFY